MLYIPPGTYRITKRIEIRYKNMIIRGAGKDKTILYFPFSLTDVYNNTWSEGGQAGVSDYSHGTGFINYWGWDPIVQDRTYMAKVTAPAARGDTTLQVSSIGCV